MKPIDLYKEAMTPESTAHLLNTLWRHGYSVVLTRVAFDRAVKVTVERIKTPEEMAKSIVPWAAERIGHIQTFYSTSEATACGIDMAMEEFEKHGPLAPWTPSEENMHDYIEAKARKLAEQQ